MLKTTITKNKYLITAVIGVLGFLDAVYLTILHFKNVIPPCTVKGCEVVLNSELSVIFGVPLSLLGTVFYISIIILSLINLTTKNSITQKLLNILALIGFCISIILLIDQVFIIHALCQYCLFSLITSTAIFITLILGKIWKPKTAEET